MESTSLKINVLTASGVLVVVFGVVYAPQLMQALLPFASCVVLAALLLNAEQLLQAIIRSLHRRRQLSTRQATRSVHSATRIQWCAHIDYDQYFIPTYLRRQGERP